MTKLTICGLYDLASTLEKEMPDLIISITDPEDLNALSTVNRSVPEDANMVRLGFHDIEGLMDRYLAPSLSIFKSVQHALDEFVPDEGGHILVHCHAGISRSTATGILALAHVAIRTQEPTDELAASIVAQTFKASRYAEPNRRIVNIADHFMDGFEGGLTRALRNHGKTKEEIKEEKEITANPRGGYRPKQKVLTKGEKLRAKFGNKKKKKKIKFEW